MRLFNRLKYLLFVLSLPLLMLSFPSQGFSQAESQASCSSEIPCGLNFKKRGARPHWLEIEPFGGEYLGNRLENSWVVGARFGIRLTDAITVGGEFNYSQIEYDRTSAFGATVKTRNLFLTDAYFLYSFPILQRAGKTLQEMDLFTSVGLGNLRVNGTNNLTGLVGGGLRMFFKPGWFGIRVDVNTYMYGLDTPSGTKFTDDWVFTAGPDFFLFPKKMKEPQ